MPDLTEKLIIDQINTFCEELKEDTIDSFVTQIKNRDNSKELKTLNQLAIKNVNSLWDIDKWSMVSGKTILSKLSIWSVDRFKISLNKFSIAREIELHETFSEVIKVITCIENRADF